MEREGVVEQDEETGRWSIQNHTPGEQEKSASLEP